MGEQRALEGEDRGPHNNDPAQEGLQAKNIKAKNQVLGIQLTSRECPTELWERGEN